MDQYSPPAQHSLARAHFHDREEHSYCVLIYVPRFSVVEISACKHPCSHEVNKGLGPTTHQLETHERLSGTTSDLPATISFRPIPPDYKIQQIDGCSQSMNIIANDRVEQVAFRDRIFSSIATASSSLLRRTLWTLTARIARRMQKMTGGVKTVVRNFP